MLGRAAISGVAISGGLVATATIPPVVIPSANGGGAWWGWMFLDTGEDQVGQKRKKRTKEEREALGIVPKEVAKAIIQIAEQKAEDPELKVEAALHRILDRKRLAYRSRYREVLNKAVEAKRQHDQIIMKRQQEDEEVVVLMLLH